MTRVRPARSPRSSRWPRGRLWRRSRWTTSVGPRPVAGVRPRWVVRGPIRVAVRRSRSVTGRQVGSDMYSARLRFEANGVVRLYALRNESALANSFVLPGAGYAPGEKLTVRVRVSGTTPTVVSAKVWRASEAEPADWQVSGTDTTAALQQPGAIGLISYLSGSSATPTALLSVDTFQAATPVDGPPPPNVAPVAVLSVSVSGLGVSVDGGGSSDAGGSVVSYAWDFGDGGSGSGPTASHVYAAAGSYTVTLTVTDDEGETGSVSEVVEVAEGPAVETIALDDFGRSSASGWGSAEVGGAWTHQGGSASFSVSDGQAGRVGHVLGSAAVRGERGGPALCVAQ